MTLSPAAEFLGREPESDQERAYVLRLARQELAEARSMERSTARYVAAAIGSGGALLAALSGVAFLIGASTGDVGIVTAPGGPLQTLAVLAAVFAGVQVVRAPFRSRRRARMAREYAKVAAQAIAQLRIDDEALTQ